MAHGYIWGGEKPSERLPPSVTYPLFQVCEHLEIPPVATYASVCLWNWKPIFLSDTLSLENLSTLTTFTGSLDEQWFYLVSVAIEAKGGPTIPLMLDAIRAAREDDRQTVTRNLQILAETIDELGALLVRMYESCDPHVFYHRIRPYLAGSKNMKDAGLPRGVYYDDGGKTANWRQYGGGSNAQSSLIQFFDVILGIEHRPTGERKDETSESEVDPGQAPKPRHNFIHEMRQYMPGPHRRFLQAVESVANIREYVEFHRQDRDLTIAYDASLAMLRALRDKHIQMVSRYIIVKSRESRSRSRSRQPHHRQQQQQQQQQSPITNDNNNNISYLSSNAMKKLQHQYQHRRRDSSPEYLRLARTPMHRSQGIASIRYDTHTSNPQPGVTGISIQPSSKPKKMRGTGGTALIPFLKQARDETGEPAIDQWVKKVLTGSRKTAADREIMTQSFLTLKITAQELGGNSIYDQHGRYEGYDVSDVEEGNENQNGNGPEEEEGIEVEEPQIVGLAGAWDMEVSGGGICSY